MILFFILKYLRKYFSVSFISCFIIRGKLFTIFDFILKSASMLKPTSNIQIIYRIPHISSSLINGQFLLVDEMILQLFRNFGQNNRKIIKFETVFSKIFKGYSSSMRCVCITFTNCSIKTLVLFSFELNYSVLERTCKYIEYGATV